MKPRWKYNHELKKWIKHEPGKSALWYKYKPVEFISACTVAALIWAAALCFF